MEKILSDMKRLPEVLGHHIENFEAKAMEMTKPLRNLKGFYTVSASSMVPLAYKEGVITGMEFLWSHGAVIQAGEFRHDLWRLWNPVFRFYFWCLQIPPE